MIAFLADFYQPSMMSPNLLIYFPFNFFIGIYFLFKFLFSIFVLGFSRRKWKTKTKTKNQKKKKKKKDKEEKKKWINECGLETREMRMKENMISYN